MMPPVGKSGPLTISESSSVVVSGASISLTMASQISPRLCGGQFVAMPTAMPLAPFTSRLGSRGGRGVGEAPEAPGALERGVGERELGGEPHQRFVDRRIAVGVVALHHLADDA